MEYDPDKEDIGSTSMSSSYLDPSKISERLDLVFDEAHKLNLNLKNPEISQYVNFNKNHLLEIENFIFELKFFTFLYVCQPYELIDIGSKDIEIEYNNPVKAEVSLTKIEKIDFSGIFILNYGYGDPNKIKDMYEFKLISKKGISYLFELSGFDILRFKHKGFFIDKTGDIISITIEKAMEALSFYYR